MLSAPPPTLPHAQPSLFGHGPPSFDDGFHRLERIQLSRGAWIDHQPGWLNGHDTLFEQLANAVRWECHDRAMYDRIVQVPRLTGSLASHETSQSGLPEPEPGPAVIRAMAEALNNRYDYSFDQIGLSLYRDGSDSVAWHGDQVARERLTALVATVSLGEPRPFRLRPKTGGPGRSLLLGHGDLVVMGGTCQRTWEHCVPKVARAGPRLVIMFRPQWVS